MNDEALRARGERRLWEARWLAALMMALAMLVGLLTYERVHALMQSYGAALVFSMIGISLYRADFRTDRIYWVGLALSLIHI